MAIAPPIDITPRDDRATTTALPYDIDAYARVAKMARGSSYYKHSIEDATIILLTGAELGLKPMQALRSINVIQGKPHMSADLMGAIAMSHPACRMWKVELNPERATVKVLRDGWDEPVVYEYTKADAITAGLWGNRGPWKQHPAAMLKARCVSMAARAAFPDALLGVYVEEHGEYEVAPKLHAVAEAPTLEAAPEPRQLEAVAEPNHAPRVYELLRGAENLDDDLRREWCHWLAKKMGAKRLADIPTEKLGACADRLEGMAPDARGAKVRENLGIDDASATALAVQIEDMIGECTDAKTAERYIEHLNKGSGVTAMASGDRSTLLKLRNSMRATPIDVRGEFVESELAAWDAARKGFFATIDAALCKQAPSARASLKEMYKKHVVGSSPSLHALTPDQITSEADYLKGMGAAAAKHIETKTAEVF